MSAVRSVVVLVGSNIDPAKNVASALAALETDHVILDRSPTWRTPPIGVPSSYEGHAEPFLNLAVVVRATDVDAMKRALREIEERGRRVRTGEPNAPRTIDLDIVCALDASGEILDEPQPDPDIEKHHHCAWPVRAVVGSEKRLHGRTLDEIAAALGPLPPNFVEI